MDPDFLKEWVTDYEGDLSFGKIWVDKEWLAENWKLNSWFLRDKRGLLFFLNEGYQPRLYIPKKQCNLILREAHESPLISACECGMLMADSEPEILLEVYEGRHH